MKKTILIISMLILILGGFFAYQFYKYDINFYFANKKIEKANFCETENDCVLAGNACPSGCYVYVNKSKKDEISKIINNFHTDCVYDCDKNKGVECKNNKCEVILGDKKDIEETKNSEITYSNLTDKNSQTKIKNILEKYEIPKESIENYFYYVNYFNDTVKNEGLTKNGFQKLDKNTNYEDFDYRKNLDEKNLDFVGSNCRISSFSIFKDFINIGENAKNGVNTTINFDNSAIENFPKKIFSDDEVKKFQTFFSGIPTDLTKDKEIHLQKIKNYWKENNINFSPKKGISIISVFSHDDLDNILFIGHIGLLLQNENKFIFLEKLSFDLPYQAVIFENKKQIYDYLIEKYAKYKTQNTAEPFVMENDEFLVY